MQYLVNHPKPEPHQEVMRHFDHHFDKENDHKDLDLNISGP
jgi:hypothetical protein